MSETSSSSSIYENINLCCTCDFDGDGEITATDSNMQLAFLQAKLIWPEPTVAQVQSVYDSYVSSGTFPAATVVNLPVPHCADFNLDGRVTSFDANIFVAYIHTQSLWTNPTVAQLAQVYNEFVKAGIYSATDIKRVPNLEPICSSSSSSESTELSSSSLSSSSVSSSSSESSLSSVSSLTSLTTISSQSSVSSESSESSLSSQSTLSSLSTLSSGSSESSISSLSSLSSRGYSETSESSESSLSESSVTASESSSESSSFDDRQLSLILYDEHQNVIGSYASDIFNDAPNGTRIITFSGATYNENIPTYIRFISDLPEPACNDEGISVRFMTAAGEQFIVDFIWSDEFNIWTAVSPIYSVQLKQIAIVICEHETSSSPSSTLSSSSIYKYFLSSSSSST